MTGPTLTRDDSALDYHADDGKHYGGPLPAPEPVPDVATYVAEREKALAYSPERRANYEKYMKSRRRGADVDYLPIRLDFENVSRCNFRCTMCEVSEWKKGTRAADMSFEDFKRVIDEQVGLIEIKVQGLGEPTMQGDQFFEMVRYARSKALWVHTTTNASLLHLKDNYKKMIDSGVNEVQISIDGATKEVFESIRVGAVFEQVIKNCKLINGYCAEKGIERTKMWTVVQKNNCHQLFELVDLAHECGFKSMAFSLNLVDFGLEKWRERNDSVTVESSFDESVAWKLIEKGEKLGIKVRFWRVSNKYRIDKPENMCPWPFERAYVSSDLRAVPCCIIGNPEVSELGDARTFTKTWNGKDWRDFRQAHLDGKVPKVCKSCYAKDSGGI